MVSFDQEGSSGSCERQLNSVLILKVEPTGFLID